MSSCTIPDEGSSGQKKYINKYNAGSGKKGINNSFIQSSSY